ncbi:hypothetical protein UFOVP250_113 [uncultured Caudovirales phage]|uniref:Uncharacterized protein n=1 Tax=uncultured Caudovirales phage TaxID=2100421 RepID=A0A6J5LIA5_9CAUD|nr:hypothetical protein UFOVP250_113 [uncultured Caudovirales phage]
MTKFVGKFRKNSEYSDDYTKNKKLNRRKKNEHSEIKKLITRFESEKIPEEQSC